MPEEQQEEKPRDRAGREGTGRDFLADGSAVLIRVQEEGRGFGKVLHGMCRSDEATRCV